MQIEGVLNATGLNYGANMLPLVTGANTVQCLVDWGDTNSSTTYYGNVGLINDSIQYNYTSYGWYDVYMVCMGDTVYNTTTHEHEYFGIRVTNASISNLTDDGVIISTTQDISAGINIVLELVIDDGDDLTVVAQVLDVTGGVITPLTNITNGTTYFTLQYTWFPVRAHYNLQVNISNPLGHFFVEELIVIEEDIEVTSVVFQDYSTSPYTMLTGQETLLAVALTAGDNVKLVLTTRNANDDIIQSVINFCNASTTPVLLPFTLSETGQLNITVTASNYVGYFDASFIVMSIYAVNNLTFTVSDTLILYNDNENPIFTMAIFTNAFVPMGTIHCNVDFGEGNTQLFELDGSSVTYTYAFTQAFSAGIYNVTCLCSNALPPVVNGLSTTMTFYQEVIVENAVNTLVVSYNSPNASHHPWSQPFIVTVQNAAPTTDLQLANITCVMNLDNDMYTLQGTVSADSDIKFNHSFSIGDASYAGSVNCSNRQTFQNLVIDSRFVFYDCWQASDLFDPLYKTTPILVYTNQHNSVRLLTPHQQVSPYYSMVFTPDT